MSSAKCRRGPIDIWNLPNSSRAPHHTPHLCAIRLFITFLVFLFGSFTVYVFFSRFPLLLCFSFAKFFCGGAAGIPLWIPWCATFVKMNSNWFIMSHRRHGVAMDAKNAMTTTSGKKKPTTTAKVERIASSNGRSKRAGMSLEWNDGASNGHGTIRK